MRVQNGNNNINFRLEDVKEKIPGIENATSYATGYILPWGHPETFQLAEKILKLEGSRGRGRFL